MNVLVIGSGGREHAIIWKLKQSRQIDKIFCATGNGGISQLAECVDIKVEDIKQLVDFALKERIGLTVVGPELPLSLGIVDEFNLYGLKIFGPHKKAAELESSKVFAKQFMNKYKVPTAPFKVFEDPFDARGYIAQKQLPVVIKADGLAQGKGVVVARTLKEVEDALDLIMYKKAFGQAGKRVIIEDCLSGQEASILLLVDSQTVVPLVSSQDHKRVFDADAGPNTGGMGAYSPAPIITNQVYTNIMDVIVAPVMDGLAKEKIEYRGILYIGIMLTKEGPKVLEFNVRFGDPETQAILPRLQSDLLEIMMATAEGQLERFCGYDKLAWSRDACVCVVCASGGYPGDYEKGKEIFGLTEADAMSNVTVFHSGTRAVKEDSGVKYFTTGGRVLGVTAVGQTIAEAISASYRAVEKISFEGMHYRKDIGKKAMISKC